MIHTEKRLTPSADDVEQWCEIVDDSNPIHHSDDAAAQSRFGERVVPGMMALGWVSGCIADLAEPHDAQVILTEADASFEAPIPFDEEVKVVVKESGGTIGFGVWITESNTKTVAGTAEIIVD